MFAPGFKSLDGLEKSDLEDIKSAAEKLKSALADIKRKQSRLARRGKAKPNTSHDDALEELVDVINTWQLRAVPTGPRAEHVQTVRNLPIHEDATARQALRNVHQHLLTRHNPVIGHSDEWTEKLERYTVELCGHLNASDSDDSNGGGLWIPNAIEDHPLKNLQLVKHLEISPPPEPWEIPEEQEHDQEMEADIDYADVEGYVFYPNKKTGTQMADTVNDIIAGSLPQSNTDIVGLSTRSILTLDQGGLMPQEENLLVLRVRNKMELSVMMCGGLG